jgi:FtsZ-binding cell division protein ZapB
MLSVEQVRALEERVEKAVSYIESLKTENAELRRELERVAVELGAAKAQSAELEAAAQSFKNDQARIEAGIVHALEKLDMFEDLVLQVGETRREAAVQPEPAHAAPAQQASRPAASAVAAFEGERQEAERPVVQTAAQFSLKPAESAFGQESPSAQPEAKAAEEMSEAELEAATAPAKGEENELDIF